MSLPIGLKDFTVFSTQVQGHKDGQEISPIFREKMVGLQSDSSKIFIAKQCEKSSPSQRWQQKNTSLLVEWTSTQLLDVCAWCLGHEDNGAYKICTRSQNLWPSPTKMLAHCSCSIHVLTSFFHSCIRGLACLLVPL